MLIAAIAGKMKTSGLLRGAIAPTVKSSHSDIFFGFKVTHMIASKVMFLHHMKLGTLMKRLPAQSGTSHPDIQFCEV